MSAPQQIRSEQHGHQILHVRGDSDSDLEALFSVLHNRDNKALPSSYRNRRLPASFFRPPEPKLGQTYPQLDQVMHGGRSAQGAMAGSHGRSISSPAQLPNSMASSQHSKQTNQEIASYSDEFIAPAIPSWNVCKNQRYYMNKGHWPGMDHNPQHFPSLHHHQHMTQSHGQQMHHQNSNNSSNQQQQQQQQQQGKHNPPDHTHFSLDYNSSTLLHHHHHHHHTHQQQSILMHQPQQLQQYQQQQDFSSLSPGWEQCVSADGEIYFVNHLDNTTIPYDHRMFHQHQHLLHSPAMMTQQQQQQLQTMMSPRSGRRSLPNEQLICFELQKLQKEKERLQHEQQAIVCREMMLTELVRQTATSPTLMDLQSPTSNHPKCLPTGQPYHHHHQQQQQQPMMMGGVICGSVAQPGGTDSTTFLPQSNTTMMDSHVRQNSTDSGLGGMGTTYSLPRSPEDYLSNVDEVETQDEDGGSHSTGETCFGQVNLSDVVMMDSDALMSGLSDCVGEDLIGELDSNKLVYI